MKKGFTLLELIIVIIIIGILATIGFTQYAGTLEKGREAEARTILGTIRTAMEAFYLEKDVYTATIGDLGVTVPICDPDHWFSYQVVINAGADNYALGAQRCSGAGVGKTPSIAAASQYTVCLRNDGGGTFSRSLGGFATCTATP